MRELEAADSPSMMRQLNTAVVLDAIRRAGPISRPDIAREAGLSKPTVTQVVQILLDLGYVEETDAVQAGEAEPKRRGPRAKLLSFRARMGYLLGIDTGAGSTVAKLADLNGEVVGTVRIAHTTSPDRNQVVADIRQATRRVLAQEGVAASQLHALVLGTPGVVDPVTGCISLAPQIAGWDGINLSQELEDLAPCPIVIENESHLSLLAEQWVGSAREFRNVLYVQFGIGIGGALLIDGEIYRGGSGAAGEIAYLVINGAEERPPEGSTVGPFEWYAGGHAYRRHGSQAARQPQGRLLLELAGGDPDAVTARVVFAAAAQHDPVAVEITELLLRRLGRGIANIASAIDPELILVGGGVSKAGPSVVGPIRRVVEEVAPHPPIVALSTLGGHGTALGAVRRAMEIANETTFSFTHS